MQPVRMNFVFVLFHGLCLILSSSDCKLVNQLKVLFQKCCAYFCLYQHAELLSDFYVNHSDIDLIRLGIGSFYS